MRRLAVLILAAATLAACRTDKPPPDATATTATTLPAPTTVTPTSTTVDVAASPTPAQLQDAGYWNAVLAALNKVVGDAVRSTASTNRLDATSVEALRQVYGPVVFEVQHEALTEVAAGKMQSLVRPPGDPQTNVTRIMRADDRCVALAATQSYENLNTAVPTSEVVIRLTAREPHRGEMNPTRWRLEELFVTNAEDDGSRLCAG